MLPPCAPGGTECGRSSPATATPIVPRNGDEREGDDALAVVDDRKHADQASVALLDRGEDADVVVAARQFAHERALAVPVRDRRRTARAARVAPR